MAQPLRVAILLFDRVQPLDFVGPCDVFSLVNEKFVPGSFDVSTVAARPGAILTRNGLTVTPRHHFGDCPPPNILVLPGGPGVEELLEDKPVLDWIERRAENASKLLSVCNGALLLARCGMLDGLRVTTHFSDFDRISNLAPSAIIEREKRFVDNGRVVTSAGIASGIDMCLHVVETLHGREVRARTAEWLEYPSPALA